MTRLKILLWEYVIQLEYLYKLLHLSFNSVPNTNNIYAVVPQCFLTNNYRLMTDSWLWITPLSFFLRTFAIRSWGAMICSKVALEKKTNKEKATWWTSWTSYRTDPNPGSKWLWCVEKSHPQKMGKDEDRRTVELNSVQTKMENVARCENPAITRDLQEWLIIKVWIGFGYRYFYSIHVKSNSSNPK